MATRPNFLTKLSKATTHTPLTPHRQITQRTQLHSRTTNPATRNFSRTHPRQNYNHFSQPNPYLPPPPAPKPARSTTIFRLVNSLSGLAAVYLLFCAVDELQLVADALAHIESNHSVEVLERLLAGVRDEARGGEGMGPREREFERRLVRWRGMAREEMMGREDGREG